MTVVFGVDGRELVFMRPFFFRTKLVPMNMADASANVMPTGLCQSGVNREDEVPVAILDRLIGTTLSAARYSVEDDKADMNK